MLLWDRACAGHGAFAASEWLPDVCQQESQCVRLGKRDPEAFREMKGAVCSTLDGTCFQTSANCLSELALISVPGKNPPNSSHQVC